MSDATPTPIRTPDQRLRVFISDQSDIFVGLYWQRYGWVAPDEDRSGLEDEYALSGSLPLRRDLGYKEGIAECLMALAEEAAAARQWEQAVRLAGVTDSLGTVADVTSAARTTYERAIAEARTRLGDPLATQVWTEGRTMTLDQAIDSIKKRPECNSNAGG
jgi:hypothetical protein